MSSDKEIIFSRIRSALDGVEKAPRPEVSMASFVAEGRLEGSSDWDSFTTNFEKVRGVYADTAPDLIAFIQKHGLKKGYCDPAFRDSLGQPLSEHFEVVYEYSRDGVDELEFVITQGSGVIAETGSIILKDRDTVNRLAAVAPWMHIAVVEESNTFRTLHAALGSFGDDPNVVLVTGPSKTGDIEGILIEGVHGPGEQVCFRKRD